MGKSFLFELTPKRYQQLFQSAWKAALLPPSHPHRLRHGGASHDGLLPRSQMSDLDIQMRGDWASAKSVLRYRKPAKYLRRLAELSEHQLQLARRAPSRISATIMKIAQ